MNPQTQKAIWNFLDDITQDIKDVRRKTWLRTAILSHTYHQFRRSATLEEVKSIVHGWLCRTE